MILWQGMSEIDGTSPIVLIGVMSSNNGKTGNMVQTYIIRSDIDPLMANKTGQDYAICGDCRHRGEPTNDTSRKTAKDRTCYVTLFQGPLNVYKSYKADKYETVGMAELPAVGAGRKIRVGAYGDPAAVPSYGWLRLLSRSVGTTGYTHQWQSSRLSPATAYCMASVDNMAEAHKAWDSDYRTFRVLPLGEYKAGCNLPLKGKEVFCPATPEGGDKSSCVECLLCFGAGGAKRGNVKSVVAVAHGASRNKII